MASKKKSSTNSNKKKTSAYTRSRNNVLRLQRELKKLGGKYDDRHILTENEQRKKGRSGSELTKATNQMKTLEKEIRQKLNDRKYYLYHEDIADEVNDIYQTEQIMNDLDEIEPYRQELGNYLVEEEYYPDGGELAANVTEEFLSKVADESYYEQVYDEFDDKAHEPVSEQTHYGRKKRNEIRASGIRARFSVWSMLMHSYQEDGKAGTGWKIANSNGMATENLDGILYGSTEEAIQQSLHGLENILMGRALTQEEWQDIDDEMEYNDVYGEYGL